MGVTVQSSIFGDPCDASYIGSLTGCFPEQFFLIDLGDNHSFADVHVCVSVRARVRVYVRVCARVCLGSYERVCARARVIVVFSLTVSSGSADRSRRHSHSPGAAVDCMYVRLIADCPCWLLHRGLGCALLSALTLCQTHL